jgi:FkbM family methyltransferase
MERLEEVLVQLPGFPRPALRLVDVGFLGGLEQEWDRLAGELEVIAFEPDDREAEGTPYPPSWVVLDRVLQDVSAPTRLFVARAPGRTSLYPPNKRILDRFPNPGRFDTISVEEVDASRVSTLDAVLAEAPFNVDFLKLDTQGSELAILRGGRRALAEMIVGVRAEVSFLPVYEGQPLFAEVDGFLRQHGFELFDLSRAHWKRAAHEGSAGKGQLVFGDALYFLGERAFVERFRGAPDAVEKALALALAAVVYGLNDFAVSVAEACLHDGWGDPRITRVADVIRAHDESVPPWFWQDGLLGNREAEC